MDEVIDTEITVDLGLKDQLIINVATAVVGLIAGKLVEKAYVNTITRAKLNKLAAATEQ